MARIGEIYSSPTSDSRYCFQFVARDLTQLNSEVIAIWKNTSSKELLSHSEQRLPEPDMFLHTTVLAGVKMGTWERVGMASPIDFTMATFKSADHDYLRDKNPDDKLCKKWQVWKINEDRSIVKKNLYEDKRYMPGWVYPPKVVEYIIQNDQLPPQSFYDD